MKRAFLAAALLTFVASSFPASGQSRDPNASLKAYAARVVPRCADATTTFEPLKSAGPVNFSTFVLTIRSEKDKYCGSQKYVLHSPKTQQVLIGTIVPLPNDKRPANVRISEETTRLLGKPATANISPFPLPDGLKAVAVMRQTPFGPFAYNGFVDASQQFLIIGFRGLLTTDPAKTIRDALGAGAAARRGNAAAKVEILEVSDFQCPTCARAHEKIEPIIQKNLSRINYVRIDLPLFEHHEWALPAAMAARALQRVAPGKYWQYVDYVFKNQEQISKRKIDDVVREWMNDNDVDWPAVQKIYNSNVERQVLLEQVSRAFAIGVASTPTFVVNGQIMGFGPDGAFTIDAINKAIAAAPAAKKSAK